jgi:type IV pilus assembly protein PilN
MPRINLLPWREQQRKERKLAFLVGLGAATAVALLAIVVSYLWIGSMIDGQHGRNALLRNEIGALDRQIQEINNLEAQKQQFIARMQIIEKLQRSRPEIVHIFDAITRAVPDGIFLNDVTQTGKRFKFHGIAQSHTRVSSFMRNIETSTWLGKPELEVIETKKDSSATGSDFTLYAEQAVSAADDDVSGQDRASAKRGSKTGARQ